VEKIPPEVSNSIPLDASSLYSLLLPLAVIDREVRVIWRNSSWGHLLPEIEGFLLRGGIKSRIRDAFREGRMVVLRSVEIRPGEFYDLWFLSFSEERALILSTDVSVYAVKQEEELVHRGLDSAMMVFRGILHEIRNPLTALHTLSQLLQKTIGYDPKGYLQEMRENIRRIDHLLVELSSFTGPVRLRLEPANIHGTLDDVLRHLHPLIEEKRIQINRDFDPSIPDLRVDVNRLFRAILNIIQNAIEASPEGGRVDLRTRVDPFDRFSSPTLLLEVRDYGKGLAKDVETNLFTPFFTTKPQGMGLGLVIAYHFIREHGGTLTLVNHTEGGAVARIFLPFEPK
jgi:signal transduction histidine kinase